MLVRPPSGKKALWQELLRHELLEALEHRPVVVVPVGSVEQHGPHCPPDVDISVPYHLAIRAAEAIADFPVIVAPPVTFGFTHYNMGEVGTITASVETYIALVSEVCRSIWANGFKRIICLNGHGGNRDILRVISVKLSEEDVWMLPITYWEMVPRLLSEAAEADGSFIGHGGEWETSLQLYLRPAMIERSHLVANYKREPRFTDEILAFTSWPERRRERPDGVADNPLVATAEKGRLLFEAARDMLIEVCRQYHALPVRGYREFGSHCP
jgi:creatinine amidohydrolase